MDKLHTMAEALLEEETLDAEAVEAILEGKPRPRNQSGAPPAGEPSPSPATEPKEEPPSV